METNESYQKLGKTYLQDCYAQAPLCFKGGEGCHLIDVEDHSYLDCVGGIAVNALGYGNKELSCKLKETIDSGLLHCSNLYYNPHAINAARMLCELSDMDRVFFCNSGAEANEAALKLARKFGKKDGRFEVISFNHSFHGRTMGAVTATGQEKYRSSFLPLVPGFVYAEYNDLESVKALIHEKSCAVICEPLQGEGGLIAADKEFLAGLRKLCDEHNLLLIFDEVQCGMGRCGKPFCWQNYQVQPDIMTLAKALGCGIPAGAMVAKGEVAHLFSAGDHASTFGGGPLAMSAAELILQKLKDGELCSHVQEMGLYLREQLTRLVGKYPTKCTSVRGLGLMDGLVLTIPPSIVVEACRKQGLLVCSAGHDVLRFVPPLVITKEELSLAVSIVDKSLASL
ncbi:MAG: aspartate aminotransferase family protein [Sphaerochaetaceae bacterium]